MPRVPCQVVRGGQHRRTQLCLCCSRVIVRHGCQLSEVAFDVYVPLSAPSQRPQQRRNSIASPHPTIEGTDTTLCPKKAVIMGWMGDCYISTRLPIGQRAPADAKFQKVPAGLSYSRITKGGHSQKHRHISTSEAAQKRGITGASDIFVDCRVAPLFQTIKRELRSDRSDTSEKLDFFVKLHYGPNYYYQQLSKDLILQLFSDFPVHGWVW